MPHDSRLRSTLAVILVCMLLFTSACSTDCPVYPEKPAGGPGTKVLLTKGPCWSSWQMRAEWSGPSLSGCTDDDGRLFVPYNIDHEGESHQVEIVANGLFDLTLYSKIEASATLVVIPYVESDSALTRVNVSGWVEADRLNAGYGIVTRRPATSYASIPCTGEYGIEPWRDHHDLTACELVIIVRIDQPYYEFRSETGVVWLKDIEITGTLR